MASIDNTARNAAADAVCALVNGGTLRIYDGTPPANAGASLSGNTLLAQLNLDATAFGAASSGVATANTITSATAAATGTATFFRLLTSGGASRVQGTVGTSGAELNLSSVSIVSGGNVAVTSLTYTQAAS
jgi:hypothetical protein